MNGNKNSGPLWSDLHLLLDVSRAGSFLAAGRKLGVSTSTISRRVTALEQSVGTLLVERGVAGTVLTEAGAQLVAKIAAFENEIGGALRDLPSASGRLRGRVRLTVGDGFTGLAATTIGRFLSDHPDVAIDLFVDNRLGDLVHREFDLAIRTAHGQEPSLVYRRVGALAYRLYASKAYLKRFGTPKALEDLAGHRFIGFGAELAQIEQMSFMRQLGVEKFAVTVSSFGAMLESVQAGVGIAPLPDALAEGLVPVLVDRTSKAQPVFIASHPAALKQPHIRAFADGLRETLNAGLAPK